jgi:pyruvate,water dikinase
VRAARGAVEAWWRASVRALDGAFASVDLARSVMRAAEHHFVEHMALHTTISMVGSGVYDAVAALAAEAGPGHSAAALVTGYGTVEETLVAADLWALSRGTLGIDVFLDRHGYHAPDAGQLHTRVWREQPAVVLALAQSYRAMPEDRSPAELSRRQGAAREGAERALLRALPRLRRGRARLLLALAARYVPHREVGKAGYLMAVDGARAGARAIGREWARVGVLDEPDDVVFLTRDELLGEAPPDRAAELVATRRARFQELRRLVIPEAFVGDPPATPAGALAPLRVGDSIAGIGVSPGVVDGRARVVLDPTAAELEPGEILVCTTTDPSWVSLFMPAAGVVIDVGGQMSHGAIVARELGIPCVINTRDATRRLSTGDRLVIDGGSGVVLVH